MLLLSFVFLYSGLETSFWAGAFPSSVSFTLQLASRKMVRQDDLDSNSKSKSGDGSLQRDGSCWLNFWRGRTHPPEIFCQQGRSWTRCLYRSLVCLFNSLLGSFSSTLLFQDCCFTPLPSWDASSSSPTHLHLETHPKKLSWNPGFYSFSFICCSGHIENACSL